MVLVVQQVNCCDLVGDIYILVSVNFILANFIYEDFYLQHPAAEMNCHSFGLLSVSPDRSVFSPNQESLEFIRKLPQCFETQGSEVQDYYKIEVRVVSEQLQQSLEFYTS